MVGDICKGLLFDTNRHHEDGVLLISQVNIVLCLAYLVGTRLKVIHLPNEVGEGLLVHAEVGHGSALLALGAAQSRPHLVSEVAEVLPEVAANHVE